MKRSEPNGGLRERLRAVLGALRLAQRMEPWALPATVARVLLQAAIPFVSIFFTARIIDELAGLRRIPELTAWVLWAVGLNLVMSLAYKAAHRCAELKLQQLSGGYVYQMNRWLFDTDYENLDNAEVRARKHKIEEAHSRGPRLLMWRLHALLASLLTVVFSVVLAAPILRNGPGGALAGPWATAGFLALVVLVSALSALYTLRSGHKIFRMYDYFSRSGRLFDFFFDLMRNVKYGKDVRLYRERGVIGQSFDNYSRDFDAMTARIAANEGRHNALGAAVTAVLGGVIYLFVGLKALAGALSIGAAFQVIGAISQFINGFTDFVNQAAEFWLNGEYVKDYMDFLARPNAQYRGTLPVDGRGDQELELELRHVSFRYPGVEEWALRDVNLKLRFGERLAVVGRNGSGKTTMIKLLCRLYDPQEGEILLNGVDIKEYDYEAYLSLFSVVFQDFRLFAAPLEQNVAAGTQPDRERVARCLGEAGFPPDSWPLGIETPLYKVDEHGVEPSGGEAQKIALARALYKAAPVVVLDEPTAALDPIAEYDIYTRFNGFVGNRMAIYISHRLSSCRFCDDIAVFDAGRVVQFGAHDELLADEKGLYYQLWNAQAQYYRQEEQQTA